MKKAVVVGGSNGMGLAVSRELISIGYIVDIVDLFAPDDEELGARPESYNYIKTDLAFFDEDLFRKLAEDQNTEVLVVTAGIGRIADFEFHHIAEIDKTFTIDTVSTIKILRIFYERIHSLENFYTAVMGSIAGWMSSPCASVYAAAKAGVIRLIESVNIELEMSNSPNRILDVSPSSFKGSRFYGGKNDLSLMSGLASEIVRRMLKREMRFIPQYEEVFRGVLERYQRDPHEYGVHSYNYKESSGRKDNSRRVKIGYLCGSFEPFNSYWTRILKEARSHCDYLIVGVKDIDQAVEGSGEELLEKKMEVVRACRYVDRVIDGTMSISDVKEKWHFDRLFTVPDDEEKQA